jgi:hypothetical protein
MIWDCENRNTLSKLGWTEGSNVHIELRWAGPLKGLPTTCKVPLQPWC